MRETKRSYKYMVHLQLMGKMNKFEVYRQLLSMIVDNEYSHRARALSESLSDLVVKISLVNYFETLFDLTRLGHADQFAIVSDVDESVLLEDGSQKGVKNNGW